VGEIPAQSDIAFKFIGIFEIPGKISIEIRREFLFNRGSWSIK
jgi:hypothetical protein